MQIPDLYGLNLSDSKDREKLKEYASAILNSYKAEGGRMMMMEKMFSFYNGTAYNVEKVRSMITLASDKSKAKFTRYNLGRSKLRILPNEFLKTPIQFSIYSVDRDSNLNRIDRFKTLQALAVAKPAIEAVREEGYDAFNGMQLPEEEEVTKNGPMSIRTEHEVNLQRYIEEKKLDKDLKRNLRKEVPFLICANECFGRVEMGFDGKLTFRPISPKRCIRIDNDDSDWSDDSPFLGEYRPVDLTTLKRRYDFSKELSERIKVMTEAGEIRYAGSNGQSMQLLDTITIQFRNQGAKLYYKIKNVNGVVRIFELSEDYYRSNRKRITKEVEQGLYTIQTKLLEKIYEFTYIGGGMDEIVDLQVVDAATMIDGKGHIYPTYDYVHMKGDFIDGVISEPVASLVKSLDEDYDVVRYLINRELKKPQGNIMAYDTAYLPSNVKSYEELRDKMAETGEMQYNSSADGNVSQTSGNTTGISSFKVGDPNVILQLVNIAMSLEQTAERITGINESRSGITKATTTATTSNNNLEASRTMTYDIFWSIQSFGERVMTVMCNKLKSNPLEIDPRYSYSLMDEDQYDRFMATADITLADFRAFVNDGRRDAAVIEYLQQVIFPQDIAAGKISSVNVADFLSKDTLTQAMDVLRRAEEAFNKMASDSQQAQLQAEAEANKAKIDGQLAVEDKRGQNAVAVVQAQGDSKIAVNEHNEPLKGRIKQAIEEQKTASAERMKENEALHRHADVLSTNKKEMEKSIVDGQNKLEQIKAKPTPAPSTTNKKK